jgi:hypothetical protein
MPIVDRSWLKVSAGSLGKAGSVQGSRSPISLKSCQVSRRALDKVRLALAARLSRSSCASSLGVLAVQRSSATTHVRGNSFVAGAAPVKTYGDNGDRLGRASLVPALRAARIDPADTLR